MARADSSPFGGGGGLYLQDHRDPVQFRNIRAVEPAK